ncbi:HAMP domain-containing protein [Glycomyces sp. A-F 0318]|uniref:sensor histidine kinase n=1 Tax=Glycomyces amatae TaxID=2881355 RepID=UPI001E5470DE|nr:ATP-binding protein [Glycomyces amatae]MCD0443184.1 HAMP domain-containing protein [Glycomyces amatae]
MTVTIVGICGLALAVAMLTATALLENVLTERIDDQLRGAAEFSEEMPLPQTAPEEPFTRMPRSSEMPESPRIYVYDIEEEFQYALGEERTEADFPALTDLGDLEARAASEASSTVEDAEGHLWRVLVVAGPEGSGYAVIALSADQVQAATESLLLIGGAVTLTILGLLACGAFWVVRAGLRPLDRMESTAAAIAEGRLDERVIDSDPHTETGRLGMALNTMLARIQSALDASTASEGRLRQFLADASHELRTPLTSIKGFAQLYRRGGVPGPLVDETIGRIEAEARRMGLLLDDLLLLAALDRERPLHYEPVDLLGIAADAIGAAHLRAPDRFIALEPLNGGDEEFLDAIELQGDEPRLRQVVTNLIANALRHTPSESGITVRLGRGSAPAGPCLAQIGALPPLPAAVIEVADTGPGVAPEHAEAIFERLVRLDPGRARRAGADEGGSGLGLAIVVAIVTAHGGCVRLLETPGGGATFQVLLPDPSGAPAPP